MQNSNAYPQGIKGGIKILIKKICFQYKGNSRKNLVSLTILLGAQRLGDTLASRVGLSRLAKVLRAFRVGTGSRYRVFGSVPIHGTETRLDGQSSIQLLRYSLDFIHYHYRLPTAPPSTIKCFPLGRMQDPSLETHLPFPLATSRRPDQTALEVSCSLNESLLYLVIHLLHPRPRVFTIIMAVSMTITTGGMKAVTFHVLSTT